MLVPKKFFSYNRSIAYAIGILVALTAMKFGFPMLAIGLFYGCAASAVWVILSDGDDMPLVLAVLVVIAGVALAGVSGIIAFQRDVSFFGLLELHGLSRFARKLPVFSVWTVIVGSVLVAAQLLGRLEGPRD